MIIRRSGLAFAIGVSAHLLALAACNGPDRPSVPDSASSADTGYRPAGTPTKEPLGGQPPVDSRLSVADLDYQVAYNRAFETVLWAGPAVAIYRFRAAAFSDLGFKDNDILAYSAVATPKLEALTANSSAPYLGSYSDLSKGPAVLEVPEAGAEGSLYGQVVDHWQTTIADVGPAGLDKGKASRYLFTPPGYKGEIPKGYIRVPSPSYRIAFAFRSVRAPGKTEQDAFNYAHKLRMYYLSEAPNPPEQKFVDPANETYPTLPIYDERFFNDVYDIFTVENIAERDRMMAGKLKSLGIERGKPFQPNETQRKAMKAAVVDAYHYMDRFWEHPDPRRYFWKDRNYVDAMWSDDNRMFTYEYDNALDVDGRAAAFFGITYVPKVITDSPANWYLVAMGTGDRKPLEAGKTYRVNVPKDMPAQQFWALTVYDRATFAFIYTDSGRTTLSSYDVDKMRQEADGSVYVYVGTKAPAGYENNLIPTAGKRPFPMFRFYGATRELYDHSFKMPDFELVE